MLDTIFNLSLLLEDLWRKMEARINVADIEYLPEFKSVKSSSTNCFFLFVDNKKFINCKYLMFEIEDEDADSGVLHFFNEDGNFVYSFRYEDDYRDKEYVVDISITV